MYKCMHILAEILELQLEGKAEEAAATTVQGLKAIRQVSIDRGDWTNAQLLLPFPDLLGKLDFGGDEFEMKGVHSYRKALKELKALYLRGGDEEEHEPGEDVLHPVSERPLSWKAKKLAKAKAKAAAAGAAADAAPG